MNTPNKQAELKKEIKILENKYGLAPTKELVKDYNSPIEKLIALQAELKGREDICEEVEKYVFNKLCKQKFSKPLFLEFIRKLNGADLRPKTK